MLTARHLGSLFGRFGRQRALFAFAVAGALGFAVGNCGGGSSSPPSNGLNCPRGTTSSCTQAELTPYGNCIESQCGPSFQTCYGAGYKSGTYSGPCGTYEGCLARCGCNDATCQQACGQPSADCQACLVANVTTCLVGATCALPACAAGGGAGGRTGGVGGISGGGQGGFFGGFDAGPTGATCADLLTCCNAITDANTKTTCLTQYNSLRSSGDALCGLVVAQLRAASFCP